MPEPVPHGHQFPVSGWPNQHPTQWSPTLGGHTVPVSDAVGINWVQISNDTIRELRRTAVEPAQYRPPMLNVFSGYPIHRVGDKWYVEVTPANSRFVQDALRIQEVFADQGPGTYRVDESTDRMHIWDGGHWLTIDGIDLQRLGIRLDITASGTGKLPPASLRMVKDFLTERDDERERLALRQLLAESQQEDDDEE